MEDRSKITEEIKKEYQRLLKDPNTIYYPLGLNEKTLAHFKKVLGFSYFQFNKNPI